MKSPTQIRSLVVGPALLILLAGLFQAFPLTTHAKRNALQGGIKVSTSNVGGAIEVKIDTTHGAIKGYLPDDMAWGEKISGSLVTEPKGNTPEEIATNKAQLANYKIGVDGETVEVTNAGQFTFETRKIEDLPLPRPNVAKLALLVPDAKSPAPTAPRTPRDYVIDGAEVEIPVRPSNSLVNSANANSIDRPTFPELSQQGRAFQIHGPFDGSFANTSASVGGPQSGAIKVLAESPRKIVFVAPVDVTGPYAINVKEGDKTFTGNSRNVAVRLSAPTTDLMRGQKTTVTIEVSGLAGIIKEVPLQLDARGVINMDGGNFQNLRIKPEEVKLDGRYTTNRTITGLQAGGFSVTATVIVGPFDICLQDDEDPARGFRWNTFTGDYVFTNPVPPKPTGGTVQPAGTTQPGGAPGAANSTPPAGSGLTGVGKPAMKGCIITLSHNAPDRRVFARLDTCTKTGDASVETPSPKTTFNITDKNTSNNSCPSPPPK